MRKMMALALSFALAITLAGCAKTYDSTEALIEKVREEISVAEADTIEIQYAGTCGIEGLNNEDDTALIWYITGNEYQNHRYIPVECSVVGEAEYKFVRTYDPMDRGTDIAVLQWNGGYAFCINNPQCKTVRITDNAGTHDEVNEKGVYPYVFYSKFIPTEYLFLDEEGNELPQQ